MLKLGIDVGRTSGLALVRDNEILDFSTVSDSTGDKVKCEAIRLLVNHLEYPTPMYRIFIERPSAIVIPGRNMANAISTANLAGEIGIALAETGYKVYMVGANDWARVPGRGRQTYGTTEKANLFCRIFGAVRKGKRIYLGDQVTNDHVRDAALMAFLTK